MLRQLTRKLKSSLRQNSSVSSAPIGIESGFKQSNSALVVHGLHKSATTFLYQFFSDLCAEMDVRLFSINNQPADHNSIPLDIDHSFVLCPIRSFNCDGFEFPELGETRHLCQVRDPRDILVSEYYSIGWRHSVEGWSKEDLDRRELIQQLSVDEYVLQEPTISKLPLLDRYQPLLDSVGSSDSVSICKYETMVTSFKDWLEDVLPAMDIDLESARNQTAIHRLVAKYGNDFRADKSTTGHKRNVTPGDHRNKLQKQTIDALNESFIDVLEAFDYS